MGVSKFFGCLLCGSSSSKGHDVDEKNAVPVQYTIDGKKVSGSSSPTNSGDSFSSKNSFTKPEKKSSSPKTNTTSQKPITVSQDSFSKNSKSAALPITAAKPPSTPIPIETERKDDGEKRNRALTVASKGCYGLVHEAMPVLVHGKEVVIRNMATGLNPIDYKSVDYNFCLPSFPWITGREMAGVVEVVGSEVTDIKVGDKVWTSTYYRDRRAGCFQDFVTVPAHTVLPIPSNLTFSSAACLGVAGLTAAMTLWRWLEVPITPSPLSSQEDEYLLLWGGSTVTGQFAIQIASRCGLKVIAVTSSKTRALAEELGAQVVVRDGKSNAEIVSQIRAIGGDNITRAIDLVGTKTAPFCLEALSHDPEKQCIFAPLAMIDSKTPVPENVRVETVEMKRFVLDEEARAYAVELNRLVESGEVRLPDVVVLEGGLDAVVGGLERLKGGDMVGRKMVVQW